MKIQVIMKKNTNIFIYKLNAFMFLYRVSLEAHSIQKFKKKCHIKLSKNVCLEKIILNKCWQVDLFLIEKREKLLLKHKLTNCCEDK